MSEPSRRHPNVVRAQEVAPRDVAQGGFGFRGHQLGAAAGGRALGCSQIELAPGKTSFPFHFHSAMEEAVYILEGRGTARIGNDRVEVSAGDYIAYQAGPEHAHAITNTGEGPLRYLCLSSSSAPPTMDIVGYPDSKKVLFVAGLQPGRGRESAWIAKIVKEDQPSLAYYEDEPLAKES